MAASNIVRYIVLVVPVLVINVVVVGMVVAIIILVYDHDAWYIF